MMLSELSDEVRYAPFHARAHHPPRDLAINKVCFWTFVAFFVGLGLLIIVVEKCALVFAPS